MLRRQILPTTVLTGFAALVAATLAAPPAEASLLLSSPATNYTVLYEATANNQNIQITSSTVNGNIGAASTTGHVQITSSTINGRVDLAAANSGQYSGSGNVGPTSVNYSVSNVTSAISAVNTLSSTVGAESGTSISITGGMTINASSGVSDGKGDRVFTVTGFSVNNGASITINGDSAGDNVIFNFSGGASLSGGVTLSGLTSDQVLWNFKGSGSSVVLTTDNNAYSAPFQGILLAPNDTLAIEAANLDGRAIGGSSNSLIIDSQSVINGPAGAPLSMPEPGTLAGVLVGAGALVLTGGLRRLRRPAATPA